MMIQRGGIKGGVKGGIRDATANARGAALIRGDVFY